MTEIDYTNLVDRDFPVVDRTKVVPSVKEVALLERTRTVGQDGTEQGTFTATTRPTEEEVEELTAQAVEVILADLPDYLPESAYPRIQQAICLKAAVLIETSFFREQYNSSGAKGYETACERLVESINEIVGMNAGGKRVDSPLLRSSMAEYQPDYPIPPPHIIPKLPIPLEDPNAEGQ